MWLRPFGGVRASGEFRIHSNALRSYVIFVPPGVNAYIVPPGVVERSLGSIYCPSRPGIGSPIKGRLRCVREGEAFIRKERTDSALGGEETTAVGEGTKGKIPTDIL